MRLDVIGATDTMLHLIDKAEVDSESVCEKCGQPGRLGTGSGLKHSVNPPGFIGGFLV